MNVSLLHQTPNCVIRPRKPNTRGTTQPWNTALHLHCQTATLANCSVIIYYCKLLKLYADWKHWHVCTMSLYFPSGTPSSSFLAVLPVLGCLWICRNRLTIWLWPHLCAQVCYQLCGFDHLTAQWHLAEQNRNTNKRVRRLYSDWFTQMSTESGG